MQHEFLLCCFYTEFVPSLIARKLCRFSREGVVSIGDSTSNHNSLIEAFENLSLYHIWILHQTTTIPVNCKFVSSCIIFGFYIKPQHTVNKPDDGTVVSYLDSTSNHNIIHFISYALLVVSYLDSTSNHNWIEKECNLSGLYHIWILHQTTTAEVSTTRTPRCIIFGFYIKPQPHFICTKTSASCIIFGFYIKPQRSGTPTVRSTVVSY